MAEFTSYRPLSGLAIAGFGLAVLYTLGMTIFAVVALATGVPMLLDQMAIVWPVGAFALSAAGCVQINRSEGTRAGLALARWGMLLSAIVGLCYGSWRIAKEQAVKAEAQSFAEQWLTRLRASSPYSLDSYVAFWQILDPDRRDPRFPLTDLAFEERLRQRPAGVDELTEYVKVRYVFGGSEQGSRYQPFIDHELIRLIAEAREARVPSAREAQFQSRGVRSWTYLGGKRGGYRVDLNYHITTVEGTFPAVISVLSSEGKEEGRQWQVLLDGTGLAPPEEWHLSALGKNVSELRRGSREFARDWVRKLSQGHREEAFLDSLPPGSRPASRKLVQTAPVASAAGMAARPSALAAGLPALTDPEAARLLWLPSFAPFSAGACVYDQPLVADPSIQPMIRAGMHAMYRPVPPGSFPAPLVAEPGTQLLSPWHLEENVPGLDDVVFRQPFGVRLLSNHVCQGFICVASSDPAVTAGVSGPTPSPVPLPAGQQPLRWRIKRMELTVGSVLAPKEGQR
jgi:hypothetical protein